MAKYSIHRIVYRFMKYTFDSFPQIILPKLKTGRISVQNIADLDEF